jgi:hypothetical protein
MRGEAKLHLKVFSIGSYDSMRGRVVLVDARQSRRIVSMVVAMAQTGLRPLNSQPQFCVYQ